ncbi:hypothetical protein GCM10007276_31850 [Agaricicola taiwanensis]|uniref:histidine kinase n=1 Tax=Agaricicola taiwanensis TaxID=591372 RepID=A0A8J2YM61_9RHOB|nr:PAS domain-containing sensor histidine kinase [Agaricicola taiwanensis]GGE52467.1 hypothetical protein GCM10007276_31850 [Agaricicola taiwanensis]
MKRTTLSERALVLAPRGRDSAIATAMLQEAGIEAAICSSLPVLIDKLNEGAALVIVTEEALTTSDLGPLSKWLGDQEEWSDLPFVLLTNRGGGLERNPAAHRFLEVLGNVTFLERPFHPTTLVSLARSALRNRRRQYDARARLHELQAGEERYRSLFEAIDSGFCIVELRFDDTGEKAQDLRFVEVNPAFAEQTGYVDAKGRWMSEVNPDFEQKWLDLYGDVARTGGSVRFERSYLHLGRLFDVHAYRVGGPAQRRVAILFNDITARRHVEKRLRESEERLRLATESAEVGFWDVDVINDILFWPRQVKAMFGISANVPVSMADFHTGLHPEDREPTRAAFAAACDPDVRALYDVEYRTIGKEDGAIRWVAAKGRGIFDDDGRCVRVLGTAIDITARKRTEQALKELNETLERRVAERTAELVESQRRFRGIFDSALQFMALLTPRGTVVEVNQTALDWSQIGLRDIVGKPFWQTAPMRGNTRLQEAIRSGIRRAAAGEIVREEHEMRGAGEVRAIVDFSLKPVIGERGETTWLVAEGRDITDLKRAQDALRQAQKLEAVGQLTGGVAHDFNNLLTIIRSSTDLLRKPDLSEERRRRYVDAIAETVDRAAKLTGQLLAFARRQALKPEVFDAAQRVEAITDMLRTVVGDRIEVTTHVSCDDCYVEADLSQFETALVNIAVNARDAMNGEGRLTLRLWEAEALPFFSGDGIGAGRFICVSIADTGCGIPRERLGEIFEPFFTTKEIGKGTGLGLSQVYGFVKQSGGDVTVESELGRGTTFTLYLPLVELMEGAAPGLSDVKASLAFAEGRGHRVLVVEDNVDVGAFSTQLLQDLGYHTTWAASGSEALRLLAEEGCFDIVFSDVVMPGMSGVELGQEIRRRYPQLPVVLTSGYSHVLAEEGRHGFELLQKPYAAEELSHVLQRVMQG